MLQSRMVRSAFPLLSHADSRVAKISKDMGDPVFLWPVRITCTKPNLSIPYADYSPPQKLHGLHPFFPPWIRIFAAFP
jgi:hypothetical protein